ANEIREGIAVIDRNAQSQAKLIEDLLDVTRIISGKLRLVMEQVDVVAAADSAIQSVQAVADAKELRIRWLRPAEAHKVSGDPTRIQQMLWNLLTNAVKFTPKGGEVRVDVRRREGFVEVSVADNGQGIEPRFLPFVFDRFRQADASTTRAQAGL